MSDYEDRFKEDRENRIEKARIYTDCIECDCEYHKTDMIYSEGWVCEDCQELKKGK